MTQDRRALRTLVRACDEALADARLGESWLSEVIPELERLSERLRTAEEAQS